MLAGVEPVVGIYTGILIQTDQDQVDIGLKHLLQPFPLFWCTLSWAPCPTSAWAPLPWWATLCLKLPWLQLFWSGTNISCFSGEYLGVQASPPTGRGPRWHESRRGGGRCQIYKTGSGHCSHTLCGDNSGGVTLCSNEYHLVALGTLGGVHQIQLVFSQTCLGLLRLGSFSVLLTDCLVSAFSVGASFHVFTRCFIHILNKILQLNNSLVLQPVEAPAGNLPPHHIWSWQAGMKDFYQLLVTRILCVRHM